MSKKLIEITEMHPTDAYCGEFVGAKFIMDENNPLLMWLGPMKGYYHGPVVLHEDIYVESKGLTWCAGEPFTLYAAQFKVIGELP